MTTKLRLISLGKYQSPIGIYFTDAGATDLMKVLEKDNPEDSENGPPNFHYVRVEDLSQAIRGEMNYPSGMHLAKGLEYASKVAIYYITPTFKPRPDAKINVWIRSAIFHLIAAYPFDLFSELIRFFIEEKWSKDD